MPANHVFAGTAYNHVAVTTSSTLASYLTVSPVSSLAYAILEMGAGITLSTT